MWLLGWLGCSWFLPTLVEPGEPGPRCGEAVARVDADRPITWVRTLAAEPRRSPARRAWTRDQLRAALEGAGFRVELVPFEISGVAGTNLVASGGGRTLVGAHYDTVASTPGADDNASGVAVVLEAALALGPDAPVTWAFFDAEEPHDASVGVDGRNFAFGSQAFVDATPGRWDLAVIVESVGYTCAAPDCQLVPSGVPASFPRDGRGVYWATNTSDRDWGRDLATFRAASSAPAHAIAVPGEGRSLRQSRFSDHAPFWDAGVDAILITDTALLRNPHYHRGTDRPDTLDPALLADVARGVVALVAAEVGCPTH